MCDDKSGDICESIMEAEVYSEDMHEIIECR